MPLFFFLILCINISAQCNISNFTATSVAGSCVQDGAIQIAVPGAADCNSSPGATASIRKAGTTTDTDFIALSATGTGTFSNLAPGNYEVRVYRGATIVGPKTVTVTSTYTKMSVNATSQNVTCSAGDPGFSGNGTVSISRTGGTGPFIYRLKQGTVIVQTYGPTMDASHQFTGVAVGNYTAEAEDTSASCQSAESASATVSQTVNAPLKVYSVGLLRHLTNSSIWRGRFTVTGGNAAGLKVPGNATYTINGVTQNMLWESTNVATGLTIFNVPEIPPGATVAYAVSDGCNTITYTINTNTNNYGNPIDENYLLNKISRVTGADCQPGVLIEFLGYKGSNLNPFASWHFLPTNTVSLYRESPVDSNNWVLVSSRNNDGNLSTGGSISSFTYNDVTTRYKLVASDAYHTVEKILDARTAPDSNPLSLAKLEEVTSILQGTSAIRITKNGQEWIATDAIRFPVTATLTRTDGQTNVTINPAQPYTLGGSYTVNFPYTHTFTGPEWATNRPVLGDIPPGEYQLTLTDNCGRHTSVQSP